MQGLEANISKNDFCINITKKSHGHDMTDSADLQEASADCGR